MKRTLLFPLLAIFCLTGGSAWAQTTFTQGNLTYTVTSSSAKTVSVAMKNNTISGNVVIPSTVTYSGTTYTVTSVPDYAFSDARDITSVSIPGTVTSLGNRAFGDCHGLTKITFEESSQPLSMVCGYYGSFQFCDADKSVYAYRNLTPHEDSSPFYEVTSVTVGGKATSVTSCLFYGQEKLTSISSAQTESTWYMVSSSPSIMARNTGRTATTQSTMPRVNCLVNTGRKASRRSFTMPSTP